MALNPLRIDPTRTLTLRRQFQGEVRKRFRALRGDINRLIIDEDAFGLRADARAAKGPPRAGQAATRHVTGIDAALDPLPTDNAVLVANAGQWRFLSDADKVAGYRTWLKQRVKAGILQVSPGNVTTPWLEPYVTSSYKKGLLRAYTDAHAGGIATAPNWDFVKGGKKQFLASSFASPTAQGKLKLIHTRAFSQLEGITAAMDQEMTRVLSDGLASGHGATQIARDLNNSVDGLEKKRALTMARTEVVHAHAEGQLDSFEAMGIEEVGVMAEWSTAGDAAVCEQCAPLEGVILTVKEARGMIPRHPNCRCAWIPASVGEHIGGTTQTTWAGDEQGLAPPGTLPTGKTTGQVYHKDEVAARIRESIKREFPKLSTKDARAASRWVGAGLKKISGKLKPGTKAWALAVEASKRKFALRAAAATRTATKAKAAERVTKRRAGAKLARPLPEDGVYYHGTDAAFDRFSLAAAGSTTDEGFLGHGLYFSTDPNIGSYSNHLKEVRLSVKSPLRLSADTWDVNKKKLVRDALGLPEAATAKEVSAALLDQGYDAVALSYVKLGYAHTELMVPTAKQVKVLASHDLVGKMQAAKTKYSLTDDMLSGGGKDTLLKADFVSVWAKDKGVAWGDDDMALWVKLAGDAKKPGVPQLQAQMEALDEIVQGKLKAGAVLSAEDAAAAAAQDAAAAQVVKAKKFHSIKVKVGMTKKKYGLADDMLNDISELGADPANAIVLDNKAAKAWVKKKGIDFTEEDWMEYTVTSSAKASRVGNTTPYLQHQMETLDEMVAYKLARDPKTLGKKFAAAQAEAVAADVPAAAKPPVGAGAFRRVDVDDLAESMYFEEVGEAGIHTHAGKLKGSVKLVDLDPGDVKASMWNDLGADADKVAAMAKKGGLENAPPVLVHRMEDGTYEVIDGLHRVEAAKSMGRKVRAFVVDHAGWDDWLAAYPDQVQVDLVNLFATKAGLKAPAPVAKATSKLGHSLKVKVGMAKKKYNLADDALFTPKGKSGTKIYKLEWSDKYKSEGYLDSGKVEARLLKRGVPEADAVKISEAISYHDHLDEQVSYINSYLAKHPIKVSGTPATPGGVVPELSTKAIHQVAEARGAMLTPKQWDAVRWAVPDDLATPKLVAQMQMIDDIAAQQAKLKMSPQQAAAFDKKTQAGMKPWGQSGASVESVDHGDYSKLPGWGPPGEKRSQSYGLIIFDDEGQVLMREPSNHFGGAHWTFAKGGGTKPGTTALAELAEETGHKGAIHDAVPGSFKGSTTKTNYFVGKSTGYDPSLMDAETAATKWMTYDEAKLAIAMSKNAKVVARDLAVLEAAFDTVQKSTGAAFKAIRTTGKTAYDEAMEAAAKAAHAHKVKLGMSQKHYAKKKFGGGVIDGDWVNAAKKQKLNSDGLNKVLSEKGWDLTTVPKDVSTKLLTQTDDVVAQKAVMDALKKAPKGTPAPVAPANPTMEILDEKAMIKFFKAHHITEPKAVAQYVTTLGGIDDQLLYVMEKVKGVDVDEFHAWAAKSTKIVAAPKVRPAIRKHPSLVSADDLHTIDDIPDSLAHGIVGDYLDFVELDDSFVDWLGRSKYDLDDVVELTDKKVTARAINDFKKTHPSLYGKIDDVAEVATPNPLLAKLPKTKADVPDAWLIDGGKELSTKQVKRLAGLRPDAYWNQTHPRLYADFMAAKNVDEELAAIRKYLKGQAGSIVDDAGRTAVGFDEKKLAQWFEVNYDETVAGAKKQAKNVISAGEFADQVAYMKSQTGAKLFNDSSDQFLKYGTSITPTPAATRPIITETITVPLERDLKKVKNLPGSTKPWKAKDKAGKHWVVKDVSGSGIDPDHLRSEGLADELYRRMGFNVPKGKIINAPGGPMKITEFLEGGQTLAEWKVGKSASEIKAMYAQIRKGAVADALLANHDVAGLSYDNIMVMGGKAFRIDNGGALKYRAQGGAKRTWTKKVKDLKSMRDPSNNSVTADIYKDLTDEEIHQQIRQIVAHKQEVLAAVVDDDLRGVLAARIDDLESWLPAKPASAATRTAPEGSRRAAYGNTPEAAPRAKAAKSNGLNIAGDRGDIEDNNILVWQQIGRNGKPETRVQLKVTFDGSEKVKAALGDEMDRAARAAAPTRTNPNVHPDDSFWDTVLNGAKTVSVHADDGSYNVGTLSNLDNAKQTIAKQLKTAKGDKKKMLKHYAKAIDEIDAAKAAGKALPATGPKKLSQYVYKPPAKAAKPKPRKRDMRVRRDSGINFETADFKKGVGEVNAGTNQFRSEAYIVDMGDAAEDVQVKFLPNDGSFSEVDGRAMHGTISLKLEGEVTQGRINEALGILDNLGLDTAPPTAAYEEALYLHRGVYINGKHTGSTYRGIWENTGITDEERVVQLKKWVKTNMGVDVNKVPTYDPAGVTRHADGSGFRHWVRWDLTEDQVRKEMKGYTIQHTTKGLYESPSGASAKTLGAILDSGGEFTSTTGRIRKGVSVDLTGGASSSSDIRSGGGSYFFCRIRKVENVDAHGFFFRPSLLARQDPISYSGDKYGRISSLNTRASTISGFKQHARQSGNETVFKEGLSLADLDYIRVRDSEVAGVIKAFKDRGIATLPDGRRVEDIVVTARQNVPKKRNL